MHFFNKTKFIDFSDRLLVCSCSHLVSFLSAPGEFLLSCYWLSTLFTLHKKMKFSVRDFFSKCDKIRSFLRIWSHLLRKSVMKNFYFCAVSSRFLLGAYRLLFIWGWGNCKAWNLSQALHLFEDLLNSKFYISRMTPGILKFQINV